MPVPPGTAPAANWPYRKVITMGTSLLALFGAASGMYGMLNTMQDFDTIFTTIYSILFDCLVFGFPTITVLVTIFRPIKTCTLCWAGTVGVFLSISLFAAAVDHTRVDDDDDYRHSLYIWLNVAGACWMAASILTCWIRNAVSLPVVVDTSALPEESAPPDDDNV